MALDLPFYTIRQVSLLTHRREKTIRNLVAAYQLPKKTGWVVRRRHRQKVILLRPRVVEWLIRVTLLGEPAQPGGWTRQ